MVSCIWLAPAWSWRSASGRAGRNMCMASVPTMVTITSSHSGAFRLAAVRPWAGDSEECSAVISGSLLVGQVRVAGGLGGHGLQQALQRGVGRAQFLGRHGARSEEHTLNSSHSQISYAVFCLKKKNDS